MCRGRHKANCQCGANQAPPPIGNGPFYPMANMNGYLTSKGNRHAPTTDINHAPNSFQRIIDTGYGHVQLNNGMLRHQGQGRMSPLAAVSDYLSYVVPTIPGQSRDNFAGSPPKGIDPQSYQAIWNAGPGSQPVNPGGVGKIASNYYVNPYAGGG